MPRSADAVAERPNVAYMEIDGVIPMTREVDAEKSQPVAGAREQTRRIEVGRVVDVIDGLKFLLPSATRTKDKIEALVTYFTNNRDRMDYPAYYAQCLCITSGTVESANYHVTGARLKLQGMRWSENGAAQMAALRADLFNDQWTITTRRLLAA